MGYLGDLQRAEELLLSAYACTYGSMRVPFTVKHLHPQVVMQID